MHEINILHFFCLIFSFQSLAHSTFIALHYNHIQEDNQGDAQSLNMENVNGVFFVLFGGCIFAIVFGYIEAVLICYKNAITAKVFTIHSNV